MLTRNAAITIVFVGLSVGPFTVVAQSPKADVSEKALTNAAVKYVTDYKKQFAFLVADEEYTQTLFDADGRKHQTRVLKSELFLTYLPVDDTWMAIRDVSEVDGTPIKDREDLRALLLKSSEIRLLRTLAERNARFNIGRGRTFNEPTLPLLLLDPKRASRVKFDRKAVVRSDDTTLATIAFEERDRPTLIRDQSSWQPIPARGEIVIDAATGTVRHTVFQLKQPGVDVKLVTAYTKNEKLNLWLPSVFTERYESGGRTLDQRTWALRELVECTATYSNYRRFDVTARIK